MGDLESHRHRNRFPLGPIVALELAVIIALLIAIIFVL